jgi:hypothetical protein
MSTTITKDFEGFIEHAVLSSAKCFYFEKMIPGESHRNFLIQIANRFGRDEEEALLMSASLFPYAVHYIGNNEKNACQPDENLVQ